MSSNLTLSAVVPRAKAGSRFDQVAAELFPDFSRARIQAWIKQGDLRLDGDFAKPNAKVNGGEQMLLNATLAAEGEWIAEDIPLDIVHCDHSIVVINKPAGLVVHPAAGNWSGTVLNALLHHFPQTRQVPRAGIVHRLDKDTSGLMVVALTLEAQTALVNQLQARSVARVYQALVHGELHGPGEVDAAIGRHPTQRTKMAVLAHGGKAALTHYQPLATFRGYTHLQLKLSSGRTHQIRVHMAHLGFPLIGDPLYGRAINNSQLHRSPALHALADFPRQALHAVQLGLVHPQTGRACQWSVPLADDFATLLSHLEQHF